MKTDELFETFLVGAFGKTDEAEYHRHQMNPASQVAWKNGLRAVAKQVRAVERERCATLVESLGAGRKIFEQLAARIREES